MSHEMNGTRPVAAAGKGPIRAHVTGWGRYVFATSSSRRPASHSSGPSASIVSNVIPSTPDAPPLERASA